MKALSFVISAIVVIVGLFFAGIAFLQWLWGIFCPSINCHPMTYCQTMAMFAFVGGMIGIGFIRSSKK